MKVKLFALVLVALSGCATFQGIGLPEHLGAAADGIALAEDAAGKSLRGVTLTLDTQTLAEHPGVCAPDPVTGKPRITIFLRTVLERAQSETDAVNGRDALLRIQEVAFHESAHALRECSNSDHSAMVDP